MHKVQSISLMSNGEIVTTATCTNFSIECDVSEAIRPSNAQT
jgi:hypothetical protein